MPRRRPTYSQLPLPFPPAELYVRVQPALPPGLRELADAEGLSDETVAFLAQTWQTIRGRRPVTLEQWRPLYNSMKPHM